MNEKKFNSNDEFMAHLLATVQSDKFIYAYEDGTKYGSVDEQEEFNIYWLGKDFSISRLAITLLSLFGENLVMKIDHDLDNPIELEDGTKIYEKHLTVSGWWDDEYGCAFQGDGVLMEFKNAND